MVTGLDLVEWQIRVARGERLPLGQNEIRFQGHAIQARLYAEDSYQNFRPQTGRIERFTFPTDARVDHFLVPRTEVSPYYDSMLAKIIVHRPTRQEAITALIAALDQTLISGLLTNQAFLKQILQRDFFQQGQAFTQTLEGETFVPEVGHESARALQLATAASALNRRSENPYGEWSNGLPRQPLFAWRDGGKLMLLKAELDGVEWKDPYLSANDTRAVIHLQEAGADVLLNGARYFFANALCAASGTGRETDPDAVIAPMSGTLTKLMTESGRKVAGGDVLAIVEAMKMQLELRAPRDGVVAEVVVQAGAQVKNRQLLLRLKPKE
jgi:geranyl-CoA carboxylase alpha subunit